MRERQTDRQTDRERAPKRTAIAGSLQADQTIQLVDVCINERLNIMTINRHHRRTTAVSNSSEAKVLMAGRLLFKLMLMQSSKVSVQSLEVGGQYEFRYI